MLIRRYQKRLKDIDHLAALMSQEMNSQHRQGITLDGEPGGNMFANKTLTLSTGGIEQK